MDLIFKTNAEMRRYINFQHSTNKDVPTLLKDRYAVYVSCVGFDVQTKQIKSFNQWLGE
tara:strand:- start:256 stop:432 length:177 start_codon:yes stop_codon:yes gene_type:complete